MQQNQSVTLAQTASDCGKKVIVLASASVGSLALIAAAIDHRAAIASTWRSLLWAVAFGGSFWAAVAVSGVAVVVGAWCLCVLDKLPQDRPCRETRLVLLAFVLACVWWFVAYSALQSTFADFFDLSIYAAFAVVALTLPAIPGAAALAVAWMFASEFISRAGATPSKE